MAKQVTIKEGTLSTGYKEQPIEVFSEGTDMYGIERGYTQVEQGIMGVHRVSGYWYANSGYVSTPEGTSTNWNGRV